MLAWTREEKATVHGATGFRSGTHGGGGGGTQSAHSRGHDIDARLPARAHRAVAVAGHEAGGRGAGGGHVDGLGQQVVAAFRTAGFRRVGGSFRARRKAAIAPEVVERVIGKAGSRVPGTRRRSTRTTAAEVGISASSVSRIWRGHGLKPHLRRTFKLSNDPQFEAKFWDVVGLYLDPPEKSIVLCCDEKTQIQALQRTQPGLPLGSGHIRTETHDYHRHGTITLFAAMNYLDGKLIDRLEAKHTHVEWLRFLKQIDKQTPAGVALHVIADNYATHKHAKVKAWLAKHPRFEMHFTPTSSSWLNLVERFFAELTAVIREGSFDSVAQLRREIVRHLAEHNDNPRPYKWVAKGEDVLAKITVREPDWRGSRPNR